MYFETFFLYILNINTKKCLIYGNTKTFKDFKVQIFNAFNQSLYNFK